MGLHCPSGGFYIDPVHPVPRALVTHGHADHGREEALVRWCALPGIPARPLRPGGYEDEPE